VRKPKENHFDLIYQVVRLIPYGRVTSYGAIANYLGLKSGARMVGYAMNASHVVENLPAHRVVNRNGLLTGRHHFPTSDSMQKLLEAEGIKIESDQVVDFKNIFWDPNDIIL
jgi:methylated-DNA-protein-cysteine methyltransferase related protein